MKKLVIFLIFILSCRIVSSQTWIQQEKIVASDRKISQHFSKSVDISGDFAIVGAHREDLDENGLNSMQKAGAIYMFKKNESGNWEQTQKIVAFDRQTEDNFGTAVSISGNTAVVGAYKRDTTIQGAFYSQIGAAYVYERDLNDNWSLTQKLIASDLDSLNFFGKSVSISGDKMVIGAAFKTVNNHLQAGVTYVYEKDVSGVWQEIQKISAPDAGDFTIFGWSVSISGNYLVVGAYKEDKNENGNQLKIDAGAAYVFKRNNSGIWQEQQKLVASDRDINDWFGYNVAINNQTIIVGAYQESDDVNGVNNMQFSGSAYVFELNGNNWQETQKLVANDRNTDDWFGYAVDVFENNIIVGARQDDKDELGLNTFSNSGSAYIFTKDNNGSWIQLQKVVADDRNTDDWFGFSVAIDTNSLIIGAFSDKEDEVGGNIIVDAGSAYIFKLFQVNGILEEDKTSSKNFTYPNPTSGILYIKNKVSDYTQIKIYDINGVLIYEKSINTDVINLSEYPNGLYYLLLIDDNKIYVNKIIKLK